MTMVTVERVRKVINASVGGDRLSRVKSTDLLVQGGIISSLEIVMIGLGLEKEFNVPIPNNHLTVANFATLETLAALIDRLTGESSGPVEVAHQEGLYKHLHDSLTSCLRRPFLLIAIVLVWLLLLDRLALPYLIEHGPLSSMYESFSDSGRRLYKSSGGWAPNDLEFAVKQHEFFRSPSSSGPKILFFGDSGTIGSWVRVENAPPAQTEIWLKKTHAGARVYNFAFFMRSFIKDVMLLEAIMDSGGDQLPVDAVVITLSDAYFDKNFQRQLIDAMPYFSLNRKLLIRFRDRVHSKQINSYQNLYDYLAKANRKFRGRFEEYVLEKSSPYKYKTFFAFLNLYGRNPDSYWKTEYSIGSKPLLPVKIPSPPGDFKLHDAGLTEETIDKDLIALMGDVLDHLSSKNIKIYLFLRPYAPLEWRNFSFPSGPMNIETLIRQQGWDQKATVIDLRWALYGNHFSDSLSHYTPEGSRVLGEAIGTAIGNTLRQPVASKAPKQ